MGRGNTRNCSREEIEAVLKEQRKKYKPAFEKVRLHLRKVEERAYQKALAINIKQC